MSCFLGFFVAFRDFRIKKKKKKTASQVFFSSPHVSEKQDISIYVYNKLKCDTHFINLSNRNTEYVLQLGNFLIIDKR